MQKDGCTVLDGVVLAAGEHQTQLSMSRQDEQLRAEEEVQLTDGPSEKLLAIERSGSCATVQDRQNNATCAIVFKDRIVTRSTAQQSGVLPDVLAC